MQADPDVIDALQTAHDLEATASEKWHKQEHAWKDGPVCYHGLKRFFDRRHKEAFARQHDLRSCLMGLGAVVDTNLGDTSYSADPADALSSALDAIDELLAAHQAINDTTRDAAKAADDDTDKARYRAVREKFHGYAKDLVKIRQKVEHKLEQLKALGLPLFLSKQM
jgi:hypothetical protein